MPKVTDEYLSDKKNFILECTSEILHEKPLYLVTMRDIIKKAGFSHGVIYRYYSNLDEIFVDLVNKNIAHNLLEQKIDILLNSKQPEKTILSDCIIAMGEYIEKLLNSAGGKTCFELVVYYAYDLEKKASLFPRLKFKQSLEYAQNRIVEYAMSNVDKGVFRPQIPVRSIILFVSVFIDGISQMWYATRQGAINYDSASATDIPEMFQTLAKAVICFLGA